jgi:hypothetical protein
VIADGARPGALALMVAAGAFLVLATANSGGYRYGASDQAFYEPAIAASADPSLFPRDRAWLNPQTRLWLGDTVFGWIVRAARHDAPAAAAAVYVATLVLLFAAAIAFARSLGASWEAVALFLALLTLRHQITRTGANTLEGYMHPRILAFALGLAGFGWIVRWQHTRAAAALALAAIIHTTTGLWFIIAGAVATLWNAWREGRLSALRVALAALLVVTMASVVLSLDQFASRLVVMDEIWLTALEERTYLFPGAWPLHAWVANLAYPVALILVYRRRQARAVTAPGEPGLVAGLLALVALFLVSVPLTESRIALAVQLQVNRIFWLLDVVVACYLAWWLVDAVARRWSVAARAALIGLFVIASAARGAYLVNVSPGRPLVELRPAATAWMDAMSWLARQPTDWHVLADPQHVFRLGPSVRVAARRDTFFEAGKDPALAIYDREVARRVLARAQALADFDAFTTSDVVRLASEYDLDVFVDRRGRSFDLPLIYQNDEFFIYDLR